MMMLTLAQLPIDLLTEIFSRLPAKTLCCLKIVCKSLFDLITDDKFLNYHLERSLATKTNLHYVFSTPRFDLETYNLGLPSKNKHVLYSANFDSFSNKVELSHPFKNCKTRVGVIGSCRGLLLLRVNDGHLLLYNPTTQTYNALPFLPVSKRNHSYVFGFGYDNVLRDWKCVRIMQALNKKTRVFRSEVKVYSFNRNCWKRVVDIPCYFKPGRCGNGAFVNEVIHWVGTNISDAFEFIVTFNLRDETFSCLSLPSFPVMSVDYLYVGNLDDSLCVLANMSVECSVWIMKEYGVAESWTSIFSFVNNNLESTLLVRPVNFSMDQKKLYVLTTSQKLVFINLQTKVLTDLIFPNWDSAYDAYVYVENLLVLQRNSKNETTKRGIGEAISTWFHNFTCPSMASIFDRILNFG